MKRGYDSTKRSDEIRPIHDGNCLKYEKKNPRIKLSTLVVFGRVLWISRRILERALPSTVPTGIPLGQSFERLEVDACRLPPSPPSYKITTARTARDVAFRVAHTDAFTRRTAAALLLRGMAVK